MSRLAPARHPAARHTVLAAAILALVAVAAPAGAAPPPTALRVQAALTDPEGGTDALRQQLAAASKGFLDAKAALARSTARQKQLTAHLAAIEKDVAARSDTVDDLAVAAYRIGRLGPVSALLNSDSPDGFLDRAATLEAVAANENRQLRDLMAARDRQARAKAAIDNEIRQQRKQLAIMDARKKQAERALAEASSSSSTGGTSSDAPSSSGPATAEPAPRNSDGSWPDESCSVDDPTTSGCLTPRTLHALRQAQAAGFTRHTSCYRDGSSGEHPLGRACDFAAEPDGFGGDATGDAKEYGDDLAAYFLRNADRLAVLYVIWYRQIWLPSSGWRSYSGAGGDPASDHTNHVHLSVY
jgi:peptidoglycan DL-endopeptidase CwlO